MILNKKVWEEMLSHNGIIIFSNQMQKSCFQNFRWGGGAPGTRTRSRNGSFLCRENGLSKRWMDIGWKWGRGIFLLAETRIPKKTMKEEKVICRGPEAVIRRGQ